MCVSMCVLCVVCARDCVILCVCVRVYARVCYVRYVCVMRVCVRVL